MVKVVEIASYPKCGNTWVRYLIAKVFDLDVHLGIPDIHQHHEKTKDLMQLVSLSEDVSFYKSHVLDNRSMNPDNIIYIYRHPLDVFFSSLNYFYITNSARIFKNSEVKSVDQLYSDGEIGFYFNRFCEDLGRDYYSGMLGSFSNYSDYVDAALNSPKVVSLKYEDLIDNPLIAFRCLLGELFPNDNILVTHDLFLRVDAETKGTKNPFFWKANKGTYEEYLTRGQVDGFKSRYEGLLNKLNY